MTITSQPTRGVGVTRTGTTWPVITLGRPSASVPVLVCHGDPSGIDADTYLRATVMAYTASTSGAIWGPMTWALHATGRSTVTPWTGASWGAGDGQAQIAAQIAAQFPGPGRNIDVIGQSMGGLGALVACSGLVSRVRSVTLISPVVDLMAQYDSSSGFATEIRTAWGTADRASTLTATASVDPARNTSTYAPIADRIYVVAAEDDATVPVAATQAWATAVGVPASQQLWTAAGGHAGTMWDSAYDDLSILRHVERCAAL